MVTVVCVKAGARYGPEYVNRLRAMVGQHLVQPHEFLCLTDDCMGLECATAKLDGYLHGWWHKLTLFRPDPYGVQGRMLFLDLDSVIVGSLDDLVDRPEPFVICKDFMTGVYNSSVFVLDAGALDFVWERFSEEMQQVMDTIHGDQEFLSIKVRNAAMFPQEWCVSYRLQAQHQIPHDARVICFHGYPKQSDLPHGHPLYKIWSEAA